MILFCLMADKCQLTYHLSKLKSFLKGDDKVLFKGSRGMQMEKVISGVFEN